MTVSVNPIPPRQDDSLDTIMKAVQVASSVYGAKIDKDRQEALDKFTMQKYSEEQNSKAKETASKLEKEKLDEAIKWEAVPEGTIGGQFIKLPGQDQAIFALPHDTAEKRRLEADKLALEKQKMGDKAKENSAIENKQIGLADMGIKAENQYRAATADKTNYDPTVSGQFIDNSSWAPNFLKNNSAIAAQAAQDSWIESFLRDASGAAIPNSERAQYKEIFFPQPGEPANVVASKQALREQKMQSALQSGNLKSDKITEKLGQLLPTQTGDPELDALIAAKAARTKNKNTAGN